jgi:YoeB-like toxin of bacterial type II toxin-antitoxin system
MFERTTTIEAPSDSSSRRPRLAFGNDAPGKPEALKHGVENYLARRITDEHRLVYEVIDNGVRIAACRYHYGR